MSETTHEPAPAPEAAPVTTGRPPELIALPGGVSLRRRGLADADPLNAAVVANLDHLRPWMAWAAEAPTPELSRELAQAGVTAWDEGTDFMYLVGLDDRPGSVVGAFGLHGRIGPGALEIGYWVSADHTRRGIATAAAARLTEVALALPGVTRVEIHCDEGNQPSAAVPERLGYRLDRTIDYTPTAPAETGRKLIWVRTA
ncbi:RimJ/RimL family protein N-acetyltransferase [Kitasatospora gansuensis]|uniref:RimJ/RimL family protein N-acetyltransferase n=1 Tax=Kitasatospora gansuensis TaxID=258050 RepID=A0A7W7WL29_9ACTN|nr:GNAT family N-acetyltransferase [Kitasatospora gansuensis]MBB4950294.1 RimJ/RimL family protein N-acetyltransferase [Kitasatospora gansuensis]